MRSFNIIIYFRKYLVFAITFPDNNRARHDSRTPCGSRVWTRMQQSREHSSKGVRGISVHRICVAVCEISNFIQNFFEYINHLLSKSESVKFSLIESVDFDWFKFREYESVLSIHKNFPNIKKWSTFCKIRFKWLILLTHPPHYADTLFSGNFIVQLMFIQCVSNGCYCSSKFFAE